MNVIPRVKSGAMTEGFFRPDGFLRFYTENDDGKRAIEALRLFWPENTLICAGNDSSAPFQLVKTTFEHAEEYTLSVNANGIILQYADVLGARNGVATLAQLWNPEKGFPFTEITDYPVYGFRSILLDLARGLRPMAELRQEVIRLALLKINVLHLHLMDDGGICFVSKAIPTLNGKGGCQYTKQEIRDFVNLCLTLSLEVIPELDMPAHGHALVKAMPELACQTDLENPSTWTICAGNTSTVPVLEALIRETAELFPGKYFHIGTDELEFADAPELHSLCHWKECRVCKSYCAEHHIANRQELFYDFVMRIYPIVTSLGRQMVMWNDQIDISHPVPLPKDILIEFWRIAGIGRGPIEGCSLDGFLQQGFTIFNAYYPETYLDMEILGLSDESIAAWTPTSSPKSNPAFAAQLVGGEACAWEYGNPEYTHYRQSLASGVALFSDRLWNADPFTYPENYGEALTRALLGPHVPERFDVFSLFGGYLLPRRFGAPLYTEKLDPSPEKQASAYRLLRRLGQNASVYGSLATAYADSLQAVSADLEHI